MRVWEAVMSEEKQKNESEDITKNVESTANQVIEQAKGLIAEGNARRVLVKVSGRTDPLLDVSLTIAVLAVVAFAIFVPGSVFWLIVVAVVAWLAKVRIEILRELGASGDIIEYDSSSDKES
jgi:hypothetical protein